MWAAGLFGGLLAFRLTRVFAEKRGNPPRGRAALLARQHTRLANVCNAVFFGSLIAAIGVYKMGWAANNDWRVLCVFWGGGVVLPIAVIYEYLRRQPDNWAMGFLISVANGEGSSLKVMRGLIVLFSAMLAMGIAGYVFDIHP